MEMIIVYSLSLIVACGFFAWLKTKNGRKWLKDLLN